MMCRRYTEVARILMRHHHCAWKRDFYMEISFHFESSVIPFLSKMAPSDTYKIWKHDSNLRADTSLAGFDGMKIKRADQSFLFLGVRVIDMPISTTSNQPRIVDTERSSQDSIKGLTEPAKVRDLKKRPSNSPFRGVRLMRPKMNLVPGVLVGPIMAYFSSSKLLVVCLVAGFLVFACAGNFNQDKASGSGFQSRNEYMFGKIDMQLKLVPGNSAGTVTAYYVGL